jgi:type IV pilus assembly protein PilW
MIKIKYSQGLSLVEIMVALLISLVLMAGVLKIMSSSKRTYALQNELAKLQDDARFIMDDLLFNLRMTGYKGCRRKGSLIGDDVIASKSSIKAVGSESDLEGDWEVSDIITLSLLDQSNILKWSGESSNNPDVVRKYGAIDFEIFPSGGRILLSPDNAIIPQVNSRVTLSDCAASHTYIVTGQGKQGDVPFIDIQSPCNQKKTFKRPASIFIGGSNQNNLSAICSGVNPTLPPSNQIRYEVRGMRKDNEWGFALYRFDPSDPSDPSNPANPDAQPFVNGVQNMQILYGIADGSGNIEYMRQPSERKIVDKKTGRGIMSVRFGLLMRTTKKRYDIETATEQNFKFGNNFIYNPSENKTVDDYGRLVEAGHRHRFFTATVQVRNAGF